MSSCGFGLPAGRTALLGASAAQAAVSFVILGLPAIGPQLSEAFSLSLAELGLVLAALPLGSGSALITAGLVIDRFGSRAAILAGSALAVVGLLVGSLAEEKTLLIAGLFISGVGTAVVPVAGAGVIFRVYPVERRAWALGFRQMAVPLGGTIAALSAPALEPAGGVQLVLLVAAGAVAVTGSCFAFLAGEIRTSERRKRRFSSVWKAPGMQRLLLVTCFYIVVLQSVLAYTVPAVRAAGFSAFAASFTYVAVNVTAMISRLAWGRIADRQLGTRRVQSLVEVGALSMVGAVLFALALHMGVAAVVIAAVVFGFGALGWNALVYAAAGESAHPDLAWRSFALAATLVTAISALSTPILGALADSAGWDALWLTMAALAGVGALMANTLPRGRLGSRELGST